MRLALAAALITIAAASTGAVARGSDGSARTVRRDEALREALPLSLRVASTNIRHRLGGRTVVALDPLTRTPRLIARLDGYLTGRSSHRPAKVALAFVRTHPQLFGLRGAALRTLRLATSWHGSGMTHLVFAQSVGGVRIAGRTLVANVARDGRLINIGGAPLRRLRPNTLNPTITTRRAAALAASAPSFGRSGAAVAAPAAPVLRLVPAAGGLRLAWRVLVRAGSESSAVSVDAVTGRIIARESLTRSVTARVYRNYPGAAVDGSPVAVDIGPYVTDTGNPYLFGPYAYPFTDVNDDGTIQGSERVQPNSAGVDYMYARTGFFGVIGAQCPFVGCSWNPNVAYSWRTNVRQQAVEAFYLVSGFHDHLLAPPIEFTAAKGNYEGDNRVWVNVDSGADAGGSGYPDRDHVNNSFMTTYPIGSPPPAALMELYLAQPDEKQAAALDSASDPSVVYHEYTHGLTNHLVADADGISLLSGPQAKALDEAWADWYSLDYLNRQGYASDTAADGEVRLAPYIGLEKNIWRTQGLDCPVGSTSPSCPGGGTASAGGYTYGDLGRINGFPEPHADGEIWSETLWDLRTRLTDAYGSTDGQTKAELLVTRGLELTPPKPTFLDARDAILQADTVFNAGADRATIWQVFAQRGMGYLASARDSADVRPVEDFSLPPPAGSTGTLSGTVADRNGAPLAHARVWIGGHGSGLLESLAATTDAAGRYTIPGAPAATYPHVFAEAPGGYDIAGASNVAIAAGATATIDFRLERDWASAAAGATIATRTGPDFSPGCGAAQAIDGDPTTAWMTTSPARPDDPGPKAITIRLPRPIAVSSFGIDPTTDQDDCATGITSSLGTYKIETSADGVSFVEAAQGTFGRDDDFRLNAVVPAPGTGARVTHIRLTGVSTQNSNPGFRGAIWMGVTAVEVHGAPLQGLPAPAAGNDGATVTARAVAPGQPRNVRAVAVNRAAVVRWRAPATNGGSVVTKYVLTAYAKGAAARTVAVGPTRRAVVRRLENGTRYTFRVAAANAIGRGAQSRASNTVIPHALSCVVPKLVGASLNLAQARLARNHCRLGRVTNAPSGSRKGVVVAQSRRPGLKLPSGARVDVAVSSGRGRGRP